MEQSRILTDNQPNSVSGAEVAETNVGGALVTRRAGSGDDHDAKAPSTFPLAGVLSKQADGHARIGSSDLEAMRSSNPFLTTNRTGPGRHGDQHHLSSSIPTKITGEFTPQSFLINE